MNEEYLLRVILFGGSTSVYKGKPIPLKQFLNTYLPKPIQTFLQYAWSMDEAVCIAGSSPGFLLGQLKTFHDIDIFMTSVVLR